MNYDFSRIKLLHLSEANKLVIILRNREFDRYTREFLTRHPNAVAIHIGCGLDSLFERVDNGQVEWYDLDLPNVIELRRDLFGGEKERYHLLACPVLDEVWLDVVRAHRGRPFLFVAEGVSIAIGEFGMIRNSKAGRTASVCLMSGDSSTRLSGGWTPFVGWSPSFTCSSQCASSTSSLERRDNSYMNLETIIRWLGGLTAFSTLAILFYGIWRGTQQQAGRVTGNVGQLLRSSLFYFLASAFFFGLAYVGWIPLPWKISPQARVWMLVCGSLLYFPGMAFLLWARMTLGKYYFISTAAGAQLFADHQLVKTGPYAIVRHPMYVGLVFAAWGAPLIYFTWTTVYFACFAPLLAFRAYREEQVLSAEFGKQWMEYCKRVPAFIPRLW